MRKFEGPEVSRGPYFNGNVSSETETYVAILIFT